ncbi:hypothetical protein BVY01_02290 [bacterium I07]|nr:hypothetical protein BVY01_02290 [bacterium I07]
MKRREFFKQAAVSCSTLFSTPMIIPTGILGANAPSNRINMGFIGLGGMGTNNLRGFLNNRDVQALAVCDVERASNLYGHWYQNGWNGNWFGRESAQNIVNDFYSARLRSGVYKGCEAYNDFRDLLAREDIDAVCISTPDHWHAIPVIMAAKKGLDIYCEKPLSLTVEEGRAMVNAVSRSGIIFQTGSHHRSNDLNRHACELVRNGRIGHVKKAITTLPRHRKHMDIPTWEKMPVPDGFDYDLWLGPAPLAPYHELRCLYQFRFMQDYSGGETTNTGAHWFDLIQWALGTEETGPVTVEDLGSAFPTSGLYDVVSSIHFKATYINDAELHCIPNISMNGAVRIEGTEGWIEFGRGRLITVPQSAAGSVIGPDEQRLYQSNDHKRNFLNCVRSRGIPIASVEIGHRSASVCHIANIAMKMGKKLQWNPDTEQFVGDDAANQLLSKPLRAPWRL